jgi:hypothetical protein
MLPSCVYSIFSILNLDGRPHRKPEIRGLPHETSVSRLNVVRFGGLRLGFSRGGLVSMVVEGVRWEEEVGRFGWSCKLCFVVGRVFSRPGSDWVGRCFHFGTDEDLGWIVELCQTW